MSESDNISAPQETTQPRYYKALDECLYTLNDEERSFFKEQSGIQDDDELKAHIVQVQAEAYKVCNHERCMDPGKADHRNSCNICALDPSLSLYPLLPFRKVSLKSKRDMDAVEIGYSPRLKISRMPSYQDLLKIGKSRKDAIFLDIGSCCENHSNTSISPKMTSSS